MKNYKQIVISAFLCGILPLLSAKAEDLDLGMALDASSLDDNVVAVYAEACEKIKVDEAKSSVRMRVTDKATFNAVSSASEVMEFINKFDQHNYNVLVYDIVDNYVEDLAARTTKQNNEKICVEVTGYVRKENIAKATQNLLQKEYENTEDGSNHELQEADLNETENNEEEKTETKTETDLKAPVPLVPQLNVATDESSTDTIKDNYDKDERVAEEVQAPKNIATLSAETDTTSAQDDKETDKSKAEEQIKPKLLYIAPVEFYNNSVSESYAQKLRKLFENNPNFYITDKEDLADYVIRAKVLRAKVDPINRNTNRLQMVLAMAVKIKESGNTSVEHQNRFILFSSDEDEQKVAADLMMKLFTKASEPILNKIEKDSRVAINASQSLITPIK